MAEDGLESVYRPSSTLIIAAKSSYRDQGYNYRVLLAKRSASTAFAPDHYVFPGGVFDRNADENIEWLDHFKSFDISKKDLDELCLNQLANRPKPLMTTGVNFCRDISLRITAIREAFEEVGLLLCLNRNDLKGSRPGGNFNHNFDRLLWQRKVHNNSREFLSLCKYMDVIPDLWSLHEWSIWRSPPAALKKYDTVIYVVTLNDQPDLILEPTEVEQEKWLTPSSALRLFKNRQIWLAPMQFYEISRLYNANDWTELQFFVKERNSKGSTLLMLAYFKCTDYLVGVLPGDDYYPANTKNYKEAYLSSLTNAEFKANTKNLHRITFFDMYNLSVTSNIKPIDDHLSPVTDFDSNSKL